MTDAAIPGGRLGWEWPARPFGVLADCLAAEGDRRLLWLPVFFGTGIGLYFALTVEPPLWPGFVAAIAGAGLVFGLRRHGGWCDAALALTAVAAGFALMRETAWEHQARMLQRHLGPIAVTGRVVDIDQMEKGWRIIIDADPLPGLDATEQPRRLRIHIPAKSDELNPGDRVSLKAMLYPVPTQVVPGGRDFQRELYFVGIGGVAATFGAARRIAEPDGAQSEGGWRESLRRLRTEMSRRIVAVLPGATGGVASALITGKRGAIPEEVKQDFRDSGLSHLLSIAGLHLGLVGAFVFFTVRGALALIPPLAVRYPIKKIAAGVALLVLTCYLLPRAPPFRPERLRDERPPVRRHHRRPAAHLDAGLRHRGAGRAGHRSGEPHRGQLSNVVRRRGGADRGVRDLWGRLGRLLHNRSTVGQLLGYWWRRHRHDRGGDTRHLRILDLSLPQPRALFLALRQCRRGAVERDVDVALGVVALPPDAVRPRADCAGADGLQGIDTTIWVARHVSALPGDVWAMPRLPLAGCS